MLACRSTLERKHVVLTLWEGWPDGGCDRCSGFPPLQSGLGSRSNISRGIGGVASCVIGIEIGIGKVTAIGLQRATTHQCGGHICNRTKEAGKFIHVPLCKKQSILVNNVLEITRGPDSLVCNATKARLLATRPSSRPAVGPIRSRRCIDRP